MNRLKNLLMSVLMMTSLALFASPASASAPPVTPLPANGAAPFAVATNDYFIGSILKGFLGPILQPTAASADLAITGTGNLGEIFRTFNLGIAFFGTLIILFLTIVGVLQSGNDGEFLGKRWHSMWVPVRFSVGSALMLPLTSSGYSMVQAMVLWIAMQGVGFADSVWATVVNTIVTRTTAQVWGSVPASDIARDIVTSSVCAQAITRYTKNNPVPYAVSYHSMPDKTVRGLVTTESRWDAQNLNLNGISDTTDAMCGKFVYTYPEPSSSDQYSPVRQKIAAEHKRLMTEISTSLTNSGDVTALLDAMDSTDADAGQKISNAAQALQGDIALYTKYYLNSINTVADQAMTAAIPADQASQAQAMKDVGFVAAGAMYIDLTRLHTAVRSTMSATPKYSGPKTETLRATIDSEQAAHVVKYLTDIAADLGQNVVTDPNQSTWDSSGTNVKASSSISAVMPTKSSLLKGPENAMQTMWTGLSSQIVQTIVGVGDSASVGNHVSYNPFDHIGAPGDNTQSAILQLKNRGDLILDLVGQIQMAQILVSGLADGIRDEAQATSLVGAAVGAPFGGGFVAGIVHSAFGILSGLTLAILAYGLSLAVYIPMVPYTLYTAGIVSLVILIAEALVASSLWAVMIMHPSGEGLTSDHSRQGMMMLLVLFARPSLMLMGMVMGIFMVEPLITMVNDTFFYAMKSVQYGTGITGLYSILGYCAIYMSIVLSVINRCFAMIHHVPDRVLRWIGNGGEQLGESDMSNQAGAGLKAAAAGASGAIGAGLKRTSDSMSRERQIAQQRNLIPTETPSGETDTQQADDSASGSDNQGERDQGRDGGSGNNDQLLG